MHLVHSGEHETNQIPPIILVVDDHQDTADLYDAILSERGYWVARATNGLEALEYAQDLLPDAIVTDIGLPGEMDGTDLIRELRTDETLRRVPVLVVTGREPRDLPSLAGIEMHGLLRKPIEPETLVTRVQNALVGSDATGDRVLPANTSAPAPEAAVRLSPSPSGVVAPPLKVDKKRRTCPQCGLRLSWVETRRYDRCVYDYYRGCGNGCGVFCFDRQQQSFELLIQGHATLPEFLEQN